MKDWILMAGNPKSQCRSFIVDRQSATSFLPDMIRYHQISSFLTLFQLVSTAYRHAARRPGHVQLPHTMHRSTSGGEVDREDWNTNCDETNVAPLEVSKLEEKKWHNFVNST